jgi:hypothetical protein
MIRGCMTSNAYGFSTGTTVDRQGQLSAGRLAHRTCEMRVSDGKARSVTGVEVGLCSVGFTKYGFKT